MHFQLSVTELVSLRAEWLWWWPVTLDE